MIKYKDLFVDSLIISDNDYFTFYQNDQILQSYDRNMMKLHLNPVLEEFQVIESIQKETHVAMDQNFLKFYWPQDEGIYPELFTYFAENDYHLGKTALLTVNPDAFIQRNVLNENLDNAIRIVAVSEDNLEDFLAVNKADDLRYGEVYAEQKQSYLPLLLEDERFVPFIAYYKDKPAACLNQKNYPYFFEIDDLYVLEEFRHLGIATALQQYIMFEARSENKFVALLADAEDTPYDMYINQGYEQVATQIMVQKEYL